MYIQSLILPNFAWLHQLNKEAGPVMSTTCFLYSRCLTNTHSLCNRRAYPLLWWGPTRSTRWMETRCWAVKQSGESLKVIHQCNTKRTWYLLYLLYISNESVSLSTVENVAHCEFANLRDLLIRWVGQSGIDHTAKVWLLDPYHKTIKLTLN